MPGRYFFATRSDLEPGIRLIESEVKLKYIESGWHPYPNYQALYSALDIPNFGIASYKYFAGNPEYVVCPVETEITFKTVKKDSGKLFNLVDIESNAGAFWFQPGGRYDESTLVGGSQGVYSSIPEVRKLANRFGRLLVKNFTKIKDAEDYNWYVGPEALTLFKQGAKLITDNYPPIQFTDDLK